MSTILYILDGLSVIANTIVDIHEFNEHNISNNTMNKFMDLTYQTVTHIESSKRR